MRESYVRNLVRQQIFIALVTLVVSSRMHSLFITTTSFIMMQLGAVLGTSLGVRLRQKRSALPTAVGRFPWSRA